MTKPYAGSDTMSPPPERRGTDHHPVPEEARDHEGPLDFAPIDVREQEVVVRLDRFTRLAHVSSRWPAWTARLLKRYGRPIRIERCQKHGGVTWAVWELPPRLISFRRPLAKRVGNPDALRKARQSRKKG